VLGAAGFTALQPFLERGFGWIADVLQRGATRSGRPIDDFISGLDSSPEQQELLIRAMEVARSTSLEAKRQALAEALAAGIKSPGAAVGETQFVRVLENLDIAHVVVLRIIGQPRELDEMPRPAGTLSSLYYEAHDVAQLLPNSYGPVDRLLALLASQGLAEQRRDLEGLRPIDEVWHITLYGIEVLGRLTSKDVVTSGQD
jgi:hypothetical protein